MLDNLIVRVIASLIVTMILAPLATAFGDELLAFGDEVSWAGGLDYDNGLVKSVAGCYSCLSAGHPKCLCREEDAIGAIDRSDDYWFNHVKVGYDDGFVIASSRNVDLKTQNYPFRFKINGWGQLRHTVTELEPPGRDLNQLQLVRGRLVFSGHAFNPDIGYFVQLDGRSTSGDDVRLLDYYLSYDIGHDQLGLDRGTLAFKTGKYKVPFSLARWLSGRDFELADRSVASIFFDVNRSFAWGLYGETPRLQMPINWEVAIFNGLVTGGAETGSSGTLDDNFAVSGRVFAHPIGDWGSSHVQDFEWHRRPAVRIGCGFAATTIDRIGSTEFDRIRVADSGATLASLLPAGVTNYDVSIFAVDASSKFRGWSTNFEYYFRNVDGFGGTSVPSLFDHGLWVQVGKFLVPRKHQLVSRWSRVQGNSGSLGSTQQSTEEIAGAWVWYLRENHAKLTLDATYLKGAPINSLALDITPGNVGWLFRSQIQFSF